MLKRRDFLGSAATLALLAAAGSTPAVAAVVEAEETAALLADRLLQAYPARRSLAVIGEACRQDNAEGRTGLPDAIQDFLRHLDIPKDVLFQMTPTDLRARIQTETTRDFTQARIFRARGWLLGETEARLCTIAALRSA